MTDKTRNDPGLIASLLYLFAPMIRRELSDCLDNLNFTIECQYIEHHEKSDVTIYEMIVRLPDKDITVVEMSHLVESLDVFTTWEEPYIQIGERWYSIGDGDDSGAVWFRNHAFHIWLRSWPTNDGPMNPMDNPNQE